MGPGAIYIHTEEMGPGKYLKLIPVGGTIRQIFLGLGVTVFMWYLLISFE